MENKSLIRFFFKSSHLLSEFIPFIIDSNLHESFKICVLLIILKTSDRSTP